MDGRAYLEKLIVDRLHPWRGSSVNRWEIRGVAIGLVAAGVLSQQDADRILADLDAKLRETGQLTTGTKSGSTSVSFATSGVVARAPAVARRQESEDVVPPELRRVISLAGRTVDLGEIPANLVSLELWSEFAALNVAYTGRRRPDVRWHGTDDVGATYQGEIGGFAGAWPLNIVRYLFKPAVSEEARLLTLVARRPDEDTEISIAL